ncbi:MAG: hypothetical protein ACOX6V_01485 [Patescibacteria group bacterium]|jgi:hypothetical protein
METYNNINQYFTIRSKKNSIENWKNFPIILGWVSKGGDLKIGLKILDSKIGYLLEKRACSKLNEWFNPKNVFGEVRITAERYLIDYLMAKNKLKLSEKFKGPGPDAEFRDHNNKIGIEVTIKNETEVCWVFQERLLLFLRSKKYVLKHPIEISYSLISLKTFLNKGKKILEEVEKIGNEIITLDTSRKNKITTQNYSLFKCKRRGSYINWKYTCKNKNLIDELEYTVR